MKHGSQAIAGLRQLQALGGGGKGNPVGSCFQAQCWGRWLERLFDSDERPRPSTPATVEEVLQSCPICIALLLKTLESPSLWETSKTTHIHIRMILNQYV